MALEFGDLIYVLMSPVKRVFERAWFLSLGRIGSLAFTLVVGIEVEWY